MAIPRYQRPWIIPGYRRSMTVPRPNTLDEQEQNICAVLNALHVARLYVNLDKTHLFCAEINFLGHHISTHGIEADNKKVDRILNWPQPKTTSEVRGFLGLVHYIAAFLPTLADHTGLLTKLTMKESKRNFLPWMPKYQKAFEAIKKIVTG